MCSQLAAICHVVFSSAVMGASRSSETWGESMTSARGYFLDLTCPWNGQHILSHCVRCVLYEIIHVRAINTSTSESLASGLFNCMLPITLTDSHAGSSAVLKMDVTHNLPHINCKCLVFLCVFVSFSFFGGDDLSSRDE